jgi:hypothetical protein
MNPIWVSNNASDGGASEKIDSAELASLYNLVIRGPVRHAYAQGSCTAVNYLGVTELENNILIICPNVSSKITYRDLALYRLATSPGTTLLLGLASYSISKYRP